MGVPVNLEEEPRTLVVYVGGKRQGSIVSHRSPDTDDNEPYVAYDAEKQYIGDFPSIKAAANIILEQNYYDYKIDKIVKRSL